ncbi:MAG: NYN domain-containing protein [Gammaproteobacteria bacterium]
MTVLISDATMAVFLDLENIALGARDAKFPSFDVQKVLARLLLKGHIVVKKAYCDFDRYKDFKRGLHEAAFELIEIPHVRQSGKNSADIRMVVDALDLCYTKGHVDTFVILSGDSDFSPLVSKLRENAKTVIGVGVKNSTSDLFINNCDEFIYYDDLVRREPAKSRRRSSSTARPPAAATQTQPVEAQHTEAPSADAPGADAPGADAPGAAAPGADAPVADAGAAENKGPDLHDALELIVDTLEALGEERGESEPIWGSMIKQAIKRRHPGFNERAYGFRSFNDLLADGEKRGLLTLRADEKSGGYTVRVANRAPRLT